MATYECPKCGMSVNATCGKCNAPLMDDTIKTEEGSSVQVSKCPNDHGKINVNENLLGSVFPTHIKLNSPPIEKIMSCNTYKYDIKNTINTDLFIEELNNNLNVLNLEEIEQTNQLELINIELNPPAPLGPPGVRG